MVAACLETLAQVDAVFVVTSLANLAAGYNLAIAGHALYLIGSEGKELTEVETSMVASAAFVGAVTGQIAMGYAGERMGIVRGLIITFLILIAGCLGGAFLCWSPNLLTKLAVSRFVVGVGAGGVYPLAAIASSGVNGPSSASRRINPNSGSASPQDSNGAGVPADSGAAGSSFSGRRVMLTFSFQGVGQLLAPLWVLVLDTLLPHAKPLAWRVALLTGSIPAGFAIGRMRRVFEDVITGSTISPEDVDDEDGAEDDFDDDFDDMNREADGGGEVATYEAHTSFGSRWTRANMLKLVGTGGTWFLFDVLFYGNILFSPFIMQLVFKAGEAEVAALTTVVSAIALPGLYLASYYSDKMGRKQMQVVGFSTLTVLFLGLAGLLSMGEATATPFIFVLYCATFFFFNFGPNATTFCLPAETFDSDVRSFFNGLSAAMGKAGAVLGAVFFKYVMDKTSLTFVMLCSAGIAALAILLTIAFVHVGEQQHRHQPLENGAEGPEGLPRETELPVRIPPRDEDGRPGADYVDFNDRADSESADGTDQELIRI